MRGGFTAVLGFLAIIGLVLAVLFLARRSKGKTSIHLDRNQFAPGETITGTLTIEAKRTLSTEGCSIALICREQVEIQERDETHDRRQEEIFRKVLVISPSVSYEAGSTEKINFELPVPQKDGLPNSSVLGAESVRHRWRVEARVPLAGLDLVTSQSIRISQ